MVRQQAEISSEAIGVVLATSLREMMQENDFPLLVKTLNDAANQPPMVRAMLLDTDGFLVVDTRLGGAAQVIPYSYQDAECAACHPGAGERPLSIDLDTNPELLRIAIPIANEPSCQDCHQSDEENLGVMLVDVSLSGLREQLGHDVGLDLISSLGFTLLTSLGVYWLIHWMVIRRVERLRQPIARLAAGHFGVRIPIANPARDELDELAHHINRTAASLEEMDQRRKNQVQQQQQAVEAERARIARDLHDSTAQFLGYVNMKASALRILVEKGDLTDAAGQLANLSAMANQAAEDVRRAIAGLRSPAQPGRSLALALADQVESCNLLGGVQAVLETDPQASQVALDGDVEIQVVRIVQEALNNAKKHAAASQVSVRLAVEAAGLLVEVVDNGVGFRPSQAKPGLGLLTMQERAATIGAILSIQSSPGIGSRIGLLLKYNIPQL